MVISDKKQTFTFRIEKQITPPPHHKTAVAIKLQRNKENCK